MSNTSDVATKDADGQFGAAPPGRPVPRIAIQVFTEFPDTATAFQQTAGDRRLAKAHIELRPGGIPAAAEYYKDNATPNLLIVETGSQGAAVINELDTLADVCDEATKVIAVGRVNDVQLYRELARRGVSEYLVAPLDPLHLIETIASLYANPDAPPIGRVVVFAGARGGAGASTIAHNVGWHIAEGLKIETAIVDLDLPFGTAGLDFNEDPVQGVADALAAPDRLDEVLLDRLLIKCGDHLSLFAAPAVLDIYEADDAAYETVIDQVRASTPCVIVDLPHAWSNWSRKTLLSADDIVLVATPDLASLRNAKNMFEAMRAQRLNDSPPKLVINQQGVPKRPEISVKEFAAALSVEPTAVIPFDPQLFGTAANNGQMLAEVNPRAKAPETTRYLAELITGRSAAEARKKGSLSLLPFLRKAG